MKAEDQSAEREAFERHVGNTEPSRILFKRGGSVFAEDIPEEKYCDSGIQRRWEEWQAAWVAALSAREAPAREGWQLVPKEPTYEMLKAGDDEADPPRTASALRIPLQAIYRAMLAASPQAPTTEGSET